MEYVADTVAIVRHFSKSGKIGKAAKKILRDADRGETTIFISIVSMVEILYLAERCKIPLDFETAKSQLQGLDNYRILALDMEVVSAAETIQGLELHDRLIVASAVFLQVPIVTCDSVIRDSGIVQTIWS